MFYIPNRVARHSLIVSKGEWMQLPVTPHHTPRGPQQSWCDIRMNGKLLIWRHIVAVGPTPVRCYPPCANPVLRTLLGLFEVGPWSSSAS
jgi:hypothetical protein